MRWLSKRAENLLRRLVALGDDGEITYAKAGGWWLGDDRINGRDVMELQRLCLLRLEHGTLGCGYEIYAAASDARRVINGGDPEFIVALRQKRMDKEGEALR